MCGMTFKHFLLCLISLKFRQDRFPNSGLSNMLPLLHKKVFIPQGYLFKT
jgi:hypothetical protein